MQTIIEAPHPLSLHTKLVCMTGIGSSFIDREFNVSCMTRLEKRWPMNDIPGRIPVGAQLIGPRYSFVSHFVCMGPAKEA